MNFTNDTIKHEVSFDEVVASWLKDEWHYSIYNDKRSDELIHIVNTPNIKDVNENATRRELLYFNRFGIMDNLPVDTKWYRMEFTKKDIERSFLIKTSWCSKISGGTYALRDAIDSLEENINTINPDDATKIKTIKQAATENSIRNTKLIFITSGLVLPITVIEGNHRLIAMASKATEENMPNPLMEKVYIGVSPQMKDCALHIEQYSSLLHAYV